MLSEKFFEARIYMNRVIVLVFALLLASSSAIAEDVSRYQMDLDHDGAIFAAPNIGHTLNYI